MFYYYDVIDLCFVLSLRARLKMIPFAQLGTHSRNGVRHGRRPDFLMQVWFWTQVSAHSEHLRRKKSGEQFQKD